MQKDSRLYFDEWVLDLNSNTLSSREKAIQLENRQCQVLHYFIVHAGLDISKDELLSSIWNDRLASEDALYVCITHLRKALNDNYRNPKYIKTLPGVGYRFIANETSIPNSSTEPKQQKTSLNIKALIALFTTACIIALIVVLSWLDQPTTQEVTSTITQRFQHARYLLASENGDTQQAFQILQDIIQQQPDYAPAYALIAEQNLYPALRSRDAAQIQKIRELATKALSLDKKNKSAHLTIASISFLRDWDFQQAEPHYQQALGYSYAESAYAQFLLAFGRFQDAETYTQAYINREPKAFHETSSAWIYTMSGAYNKAFQALKILEEITPDNFYYHVSLQSLYELTNQENAAINELLWIMEHAGYPEDVLVTLKNQTQDSGISAIYRWLAFEDTLHLNIGQYEPPLSLARYALAIGDEQTAMNLLKLAVEQRHFEVLWINVDPRYQALRETALFDQLLEVIGISLYQPDGSLP